MPNSQPLVCTTRSPRQELWGLHSHVAELPVSSLIMAHCPLPHFKLHHGVNFEQTSLILKYEQSSWCVRIQAPIRGSNSFSSYCSIAFPRSRFNCPIFHFICFGCPILPVNCFPLVGSDERENGSGSNVGSLEWLEVKSDRSCSFDIIFTSCVS